LEDPQGKNVFALAKDLAKSNSTKALVQARRIDEPWSKAQALAWVARFSDEDSLAIAAEAAKAADVCDDDYKRSAVRAWEISALAERGYTRIARKSLEEALEVGRRVDPKSSRSEALFLLLQAAFRISLQDAERVYEILREVCPVEEHWRCKRAVRDGARMIAGEIKPRSFFW
jgi:hypothetical protein